MIMQTRKPRRTAMCLSALHFPLNVVVDTLLPGMLSDTAFSRSQNPVDLRF